MEQGSPASSRRPSLTLSQLEIPITPSQSATLEQIHASNSAATGLTSFYLGSPPPAAPTPLTFNRLYSKVKSVAAGVREAVREAVVVGTPGRSRSGTNDSRESFENFSIGSSSNRASPTASNFQFRTRYNNPHRLSLSNASIMSKGSTGSTDGGTPSALRKVNILTPGPKSTPSPSLAQVTVFRDRTGAGDSAVAEGSFNGAAMKGANGVGISTGYSSPSSESVIFGNRYSALQDGVEYNIDNTKAGVDGSGEEQRVDGSENITHKKAGASGASGGGNSHVMPQSTTQTHIANQNLQSALAAQIPQGSHTTVPPVVQSHVMGDTLLNQAKRKSSSSIGGLSSNKSIRKRPKSVKRTSENLLPGFAYNSESDTEDDEEDNTSSPADTSSVGAKTSMQRFGTRNKAVSSIPGVGGVRALAGWFGVGGNVSDTQGSDRSSVAGAVNGSGSGGNIEAVGLALQQLRKGTLSKEFWMKDENCKDCFLCGKTFNAFRRKHHCRKSPVTFSQYGKLVNLNCGM